MAKDKIVTDEPEHYCTIYKTADEAVAASVTSKWKLFSCTTPIGGKKVEVFGLAQTKLRFAEAIANMTCENLKAVPPTRVHALLKEALQKANEKLSSLEEPPL